MTNKAISLFASIALTTPLIADQQTEAKASFQLSDTAKKVISEYTHTITEELWKINETPEKPINLIAVMQEFMKRSAGEEKEEHHDEEDHDHHEHRHTFGKNEVKNFKQLDVNGDFKLSREEAIGGINVMLTGFVSRSASLDSDGDRLLTAKEMKLGRPNNDKLSKEHQEEEQKEWDEFFKRSDVNNDQLVSEVELVNSIAPEFVDFVRALQVSYNIPKLDINADDKLDHNEVKDLLPDWIKDEGSLPLNKIHAEVYLLNPKQLKSLANQLDKK